MKRTTERQMRSIVAVQQTKVGENLRKMRLKRGETQDTLAVGAGIDRKTVNRIENGRFSPSLETMTRLAEVLKIKIADLVK